MPAGARPAGGPNPKRPAARRRRSADGASRAAPGRPPQDRARPAHAHGLASTATLCGGIGTVGALWILLALLGFLPTVGGTNPVRFESDSILGMRILSRSDFPTARQYLAYQRDTNTRVTGRDLDLQLEGRTTSTSLFKTMQETLDLARTNVASGVTADDLKLKEDLHGWNNLNEVYRAAKYESIYGTALEDDVGRAYDASLERALQTGSKIVTRNDHREQHLANTTALDLRMGRIYLPANATAGEKERVRELLDVFGKAICEHNPYVKDFMTVRVDLRRAEHENRR